MKHFKANKLIDRDNLAQLGLVEDVKILVDFDGWLSIFNYQEPTYGKLTLQFFRTFELDMANIR